MPRRLLPATAAIAVLLAGMLAGMLAAAAPAQAAELVSASPSPGVSGSNAPTFVRLTFDRPIGLRARISVQGPGGEVTSGPAQARGRSAVVPLRSGLEPGQYVVSWTVSVLGRDRGQYGFTLTTKPRTGPRATRGPTTARPTPTPAATTPAAARTRTRTPTPTPDLTPTPTPTSTPALAAVDNEVPAPDVQPIRSTQPSWLPSPIILWLIILLAVGGTVMFHRRHPGGS